MQYTRDPAKQKLTVEPDHKPKWWVDSSCTVQPDMISHTMISMNIGKGTTCMESCKK